MSVAVSAMPGDTGAPNMLTAEFVLPELKNVVVPPPDLRPIVEKTAAYVAKHGTAFEAVILSKQQNDRRFDFLHPDNAYHSYYKSKLVQLLLPPEEQERLAQLQEEQEAERQALAQLEAEQAAADAAADAAAAPPSKPAALTARERLKLEIARAAQAHVIPTSAADLDPAYASVLPESFGVSALDRDIIRLTARFVASQGKAFLNGLLTREARNPSFDFMRSSHPYYPYFQGTVQAYEMIMGGRLAQVEKQVQDTEAVREEVLGRIEYERIQEKLVGQRAHDDERERQEMALIDWHDFVVLRVVDFADDEAQFLPAPFNTIEEINRALEAQDQLQADRDIEMDVETDMAVESAPEPPPEIVTDAHVKDLAQAERNRAQTNAIQFQKCPSCGELVRQNELSEHVRICLLDPRWKVQKQASMLKQRDSNLISGADISRHLSELARRRQDIFTTPAGAGSGGDVPTTESVAPDPQQHQPQQQFQQPPQQHQQHEPAAYAAPEPMPPMPLPYPPQFMPLPNQAMAGFPQPVQYHQPYGPPPSHMMAPPPPMPYMGPPGAAGFPPQQPPPPAHLHMPPPPPPPKRSRTTEPAAAWASRYPDPVEVVVQMPAGATPQLLPGQTVTLRVPILSTTLQLKRELGKHLDGMAPKKMKLQVADDGHWLKDSESLAELNLVPGVRLNFELKERGRKK